VCSFVLLFATNSWGAFIRALARSASNEQYFGLQLGTKSAGEALAAVENALETNARIRS
jgi:hypothetical protein